MSNSNRSFSRRQFLKGDNGPSDLMQRAAEAIQKVVPADHGFVVLVFPIDSRDGGVRYVSNGDRGSVLNLLREFVAKADAKPLPPEPEKN